MSDNELVPVGRTRRGHIIFQSKDDKAGPNTIAFASRDQRSLDAITMNYIFLSGIF